MEEKNKKSGIVIIGILAMLIGLVISIQISSADTSEVGGLIPVAQVTDLERDLKNVRAEKEAITQELMEAEERLAELEKDSVSENELLQNMTADLEKYKMISGVVDVKGPGLIATLDDPVPTEEDPGDGYSVLILRYEMLLEFVNKLKEAGAEAISINGHRVVNTTEITLAGDNLNINSTPTAPPYTVKAIGNPETLEGTLTIRFGIVENMRNQGIQVSLAKQEELEISRYSGVIKFRYASPVTADDSQSGGQTGQ